MMLFSLVFPCKRLNFHVFRWVVENQIGQKELVIDDCDAKQTIYVYGCQNSVLQVIGI